MLYREIFRLVGIYLWGFALCLLIPLGVAAYFEFFADPLGHPQPHSTLYFLYTFLVTLGLGTLFFFWGRKAVTRLYRREGIAAVVFIWLLTPALSALPFIWSGTLSNPYQAYFELVSGYTTTGSTVLQAKKFDETGQEILIRKTIPGVHNTEYAFYGTVAPVVDPVTKKVVVEGIEAVSKALLFWRSFTQWLGGLGVVVLFVAVLPALGVGGKMLYQAEVPGPIKEGLSPRIQETAIQLWKIYLILTAAQIIMLHIVNPSLEVLDTVTITFSTLSTGGLSIKNTSIAAYHSPVTEMIVMIFMFLGGVNFALYYYVFKGKFYKLYESEFLLYLLIVIISCFLMAMTILGAPKMNLDGIWDGTFGFWESLRYGFFQGISAQTSTGFTTTNFDVWPYFPQVLLIIVMYIGGMSGSTSGGIKILRIFMLFRIAQYKVESLFRPETVRSFRVGGKEVDTGAASMVLIFFLIVISLSALATILFVLDGIDPETALGMVTCLINNAGIGFRMASPLDSFAFCSNTSLTLASLLMIMGRLEFYAFLAVFIPAFWKQD